MLGAVGSILVGGALAAAVCAACVTLWAIWRAHSVRIILRAWDTWGRRCTCATAGLLGLAVVVLVGAFVGDQFQMRYVAQHSSRVLPVYLKVSAVWAGQEGSLLLWSFLQAMFAALVAGRVSEQGRPLAVWATVFLNLITAFMVAVTLFLSDPFARSRAFSLEGQGLHPLLRHPGMVFHPPAMYVGYVGLSVPFAFALAALITHRVDEWPGVVRRWTLAAWLFLGLGLVLGARWAYDVLGWGGYWGWDPVENAGLMPWLTTTALLHGLMMQERSGGFRWWNVLLAVFSFVLVLFGTFATRSGLILSVHAFAVSGLGPSFLAFIGVVLVGCAVLLWIRRSSLAATRPPESGSLEGMFLLTLTLLVTLTASIWVGSVLPTLSEALTRRRLEAGPSWFDRVTGPQFAALVLLMGVCPLLGRTADSLRRSARRALPAVLGAVAVSVAAAVAGFTRLVSLVGFAIIGLAGGTMAAEIARSLAARARREGGWGARMILGGGRGRRYGGYLVHVGIVLLALGVMGTRLYASEAQVVLDVGEPVDVGRYTLVLEELEQRPAGDHLVTMASLALYRGGAFLATLQPRQEQYFQFDQAVGVPASWVGWREDVYVVLGWWARAQGTTDVPPSVTSLTSGADGGDGATAVFEVIVNPLVSFVWLGGLVLLAGGVVAFWPPVPRAHWAQDGDD